MKKNIAVIIAMSILFVLSFAVFLSVVSANFTLASGNLSYSIDDKYAPNDVLSGWINLSLTNEPYNSVLTGFDSSISLKDFLDKLKTSGVKYTCSSSNCSMTLSSSDSGSSSKELQLNSGSESIVGFKIIDEDYRQVNSISINLASDAAESDSTQFLIDIGSDGVIDWRASTPKLGSYSTDENYGCYLSASKKGTFQIEFNKDYCEKVTINSAAALLLGADVEGTGIGKFQLSVDDKTCLAEITGNGKVSCTINLSVSEPTQLDVCIKQFNQAGATVYSLSYEDISPKCGLIDGTDTTNDFSVFARPIKFAAIGSVIINNSNTDSSDFDGLISSYISENYWDNCSLGCYVPIKIISKTNQKININSAVLSYNGGGITKHNSVIYNLVYTPSMINLPYAKLDLSKAGFKVPSSSGNSTLSLKLNGQEILTKKITVLSLPVIEDISPYDAPAAADTQFTVFVTGTNVTNYKWSFGDNTSIQETTKNSIYHKYNTPGKYTLIVSAKNSQGERNNSFVINVVSPKDYLNSTLANYKTNLAGIKTAITKYPALVQSALEKKLNIAQTEIKVQQLQTEFNSAGNSTTKYIELLNTLSALDVPNYINITEKTSGKYIFDSSMVDVAGLQNITSEAVDSGTEEQIRNAVFAWFLNSADVNMDLSVYSGIYRNYSKPLVSYADVKINRVNPSSSDEVYAVIGRLKSDIDTNSQIISGGGSSGIKLDLSSGSAGFQFALPGEESFIKLPLYFSPLISQLSLALEIGTCNHNKKCEKDLGETKSNCRYDCKPIVGAITWIIIIFILALIAYIALQEWYKRKYEDYLFPNKDDLFNLVSFMTNAEKQAMKREEIFSKLKEKNWKNEQIDFAYHKYKGMRTGMWEIPTFGLIDKLLVMTKIDKKAKDGVAVSVTPKPSSPLLGFVKPFGFIGRKQPALIRPNPSEQKTLQNKL